MGAVGKVVVICLAVLGGTACGLTGNNVPDMDKSGTYYHIEESAAGTYETRGSASTTGRPCNWELAGAIPDGAGFSVTNPVDGTK
jgi:hypothetical protein